MTKSITFTADETLIEEARQVAKAEHTSLNKQFQLWLEQYARRRRVQRFEELMGAVRGTASSGGRKFSREQMNERR